VRTFTNESSVSNAIHPDFEHRYPELKANASEVHLVNSCDLGQFLVDCLHGMSSHGPTSEQAGAQGFRRYMLVVTHSHAMALDLRIKTDDGGSPRYVLEFYDPNVTSNHLRVAYAQRSELRRLTFEGLVERHDNEAGIYAVYFPHGDDHALVYTLGSAEQVRQCTLPRAQPGEPIHAGRLSKGLSSSQVTPSALFHLLKGGFARDIELLTPLVREMPPTEALALLQGNPEWEASGLYFALQNGHATSVSAYGELLECIPDETRAAVASAIAQHGASGLFYPLYHGLSDTISAYGTLLDRVPEHARGALLVASNEDGSPGLYAAMLKRRSATVSAFAPLLQKVPSDQRRVLLSARAKNGWCALSAAIKWGRHESIAAFASILAVVPATDRAAVLSARHVNGVPALRLALTAGHAQTVSAYGALLRTLDEDARYELLKVKAPPGIPGLGRTRIPNHGEAVAAFADVVESCISSATRRTKLLRGAGLATSGQTGI
jgi:hypothetical protein